MPNKHDTMIAAMMYGRKLHHCRQRQDVDAAARYASMLALRSVLGEGVLVGRGQTEAGGLNRDISADGG